MKRIVFVSTLAISAPLVRGADSAPPNSTGVVKMNPVRVEALAGSDFILCRTAYTTPNTWWLRGVEHFPFFDAAHPPPWLRALGITDGDQILSIDGKPVAALDGGVYQALFRDGVTIHLELRSMGATVSRTVAVHVKLRKDDNVWLMTKK